MLPKVLVIGATGMAGHMIYFYLRQTGKYEIHNAVYRTPLTADSTIVDVSNRKAVSDLIHTVRPDIVINCVGILIKGAREYPENAILLNAYLPHLLARLSAEVGAKLIHISTDCVFSGKKGSYTETDFRDADDIYGRSKALGEVINDRDLTIRTSIIGPELKQQGEGLFHWFMYQSGSVNGFQTAIWGGVTTLELAKAIDEAIRQRKTGLIQLSNGQGIDKYSLLCLFRRIWEKDIEIIPLDANGIDKSIACSVRFDYSVPDYEVMLNELKAWMDVHRDLYEPVY